MRGKLQIQLPAGYRWVELNEVKNESDWLYADDGYWNVSGHDGNYCCKLDYYYITSCTTPAVDTQYQGTKPDNEDKTTDTTTQDVLFVPVCGHNSMLYFINPNTDLICGLNYATTVVGPTWAFDGFVFEDGNVYGYFHHLSYDSDRVVYCKQISFRKVV